MHNISLALDAAWRVLLVGLLLGAGLPAIFALGIRSLAYGTGGAAEVDSHAAPHPIGRVGAVICFAVVVLAIALGIAIVVASGIGKAVDFSHVYPMFVDKKH